MKKETKKFQVPMNDASKDHKDIQKAATLLQAGEVVAFPTETVYGLGADATNNQAIDKIFEAKARPQDNPLIVHIGSKSDVEKYVSDYPFHAKQLVEAFWPGALTVILPAKDAFARNVTAGLTTVGLRMPDHPVAQAILQASDLPIAAPSANLSGKPSPITAEHVLQDLDGRIAAVVDGGPTGVGVESTVVDCTAERPIILRPGGVTKADLEEVIGTIDVADHLLEEADAPRSPGMKYKHYAPDVPIWVIAGDAPQMALVYEKLIAEGKRVGYMISEERAEALHVNPDISLGSAENVTEITKNIYAHLRAVDQLDVDIVLTESFSKQGIGQALMNRLERAASEIIID
ncbi:L-threonylcarbamoyladenylate synthase [Halalkalibacillus halophilus]|uniref:L-threonylcarbamoyladenylate synthase n=1 Tax=Halalkalibacillus halophilus TaxID=392827 RepID=UPI001B7FCAA8|nr:L-threonylcarbamoyladenylate synthase [Halalkalibacillus halophilus]